jgi:hypothetical protein
MVCFDIGVVPLLVSFAHAVDLLQLHNRNGTEAIAILTSLNNMLQEVFACLSVTRCSGCN